MSHPTLARRRGARPPRSETRCAAVLALGLILPQGTDPLTAAERAWLAEHPTIRVAPASDYHPLEFLDEEGRFRGVVADTLALIEERLGISFEIEPSRARSEGTGLTPADLGADVVPLSAWTQERGEHWVFTAPYLEYPVKILVRKSVTAGLGPDDLRGLKVAVVRGRAVQEYMLAEHPEVRIETVPDTREGLRRVSFGFVDAFLSDLPAATWNMEQEGITNLRVAGDSGYVYRMGIAVRSDWPELRGILEKGLSLVSADERAAIFERWVSLEVEPPWYANRRVWLGLIGFAVALVLLLGGVLVWNRALQRQVAQRTRELQGELADRVAAEQIRARLERELRVAQRMESLGTIAGGIAHDLNNILLAIYGFTELARKELAEGAPASGYLDEVLHASDRAKRLVRQILTFGRQDGSERVPIDLKEPVREATALLRASLPSTIEIRERYPADPCVVRGDAAQLQQAVVNLGTNAAHAMPDGGVLEVLLEPAHVGADLGARLSLPPGDYLRVTVADTGQGMLSATLARAFEPFFTTKEEGTGLGLSVVQSIVLRHEGAIDVESASGSGTTFRLYFPPSSGPIPEGVVTTPSALGGSERILVVDDEEVLVWLVRRHLEDHGYRVRGCVRPEEALEAFRRFPDSFDLVVTDQTMPGMTGLALAREIRALRSDVPVLLVTGYGEAIRPELLDAAGVNAVVHKPYSGRELVQVVRRVLDRTQEEDSPLPEPQRSDG